MTLLPALTIEAAQGLNNRAFVFLRGEDGARGSRWSDIYAEPTPGTRYAILFSDTIADAFTPAEIATVIDVDWPVYAP